MKAKYDIPAIHAKCIEWCMKPVFPYPWQHTYELKRNFNDFLITDIGHDRLAILELDAHGIRSDAVVEGATRYETGRTDEILELLHRIDLGDAQVMLDQLLHGLLRIVKVWGSFWLTQAPYGDAFEEGLGFLQRFDQFKNGHVMLLAVVIR